VQTITVALQGDETHPLLRAIDIPNIGTVEVRGTPDLQSGLESMSDDKFVGFIVATMRAKAKSLTKQECAG